MIQKTVKLSEMWLVGLLYRTDAFWRDSGFWLLTSLEELSE